MNTYKKKSFGKSALARLLLAVFVVHQTVGTSIAATTPIPTGSVNLNVLAAVQPSLNNLALVQWRQAGTTNAAPIAATGMSFAYFNSGTNLAPPSRSVIKDWSANDQGDLWSDNALQVDFTKGNTLSSAIIIYTANHSNLTSAGLVEVSNGDPLESATQRGGLVGCTFGAAQPTTAMPAANAAPNPTCASDPGQPANSAYPSDPGRQVILPLIWKSIALDALKAASGAKVDGSVELSLTSPMDMPTEIVSNGTLCPQEFAYGITNPGISYARPANAPTGFCDFSTHYIVDLFNTDPAHLFYSGYPNSGITATLRRGTFDYQSLVGAFGVNASEGGKGGGGSASPAYFVLGINASNAIPAQYGTTIYVQSFTF